VEGEKREDIKRREPIMEIRPKGGDFGINDFIGGLWSKGVRETTRGGRNSITTETCIHQGGGREKRYISPESHGEGGESMSDGRGAARSHPTPKSLKREKSGGERREPRGAFQVFH